MKNIEYVASQNIDNFNNKSFHIQFKRIAIYKVMICNNALIVKNTSKFNVLECESMLHFNGQGKRADDVITFCYHSLL